ncbi:MAG: glutathione S-transferase N-terminal domain-containing protein [Alphaproteobacteria bacterium]|nr:glutathione S-transferase N-terminal domain-containing protein [Alphaproteobacteria bacterium SS10]
MLTLFYSPTSPYVRKVVMVAIEKGIDDRLDKVPTNPWESGDKLLKNNPLSKVPCLVLDDGLTLFDSPVICEYLETLSNSPVLFPPIGRDRWRSLRLQAQADGIMDSAVLRVLEGKREESLRSADWVTRQKDAIDRTLDDIESYAGDLSPTPTIGTISLACALGYLDLRHPGDEWRARAPKTAAWHEKFAKRDSYLQTEPPAGA